MAKKACIRISVVALIVVIASFLSCTKEKTPEKIIIGAILPLTGDAAQWGIPPLNGAQLAVEEINASGGISGKKLALQVEDTRCEPKDGVSAFSKLLSSKEIKIVLGGVCSSVTLAVSPIAERNKVLLISPASTNPKITDAGDFIFRVIPSDNLRGQIFAEYLFNDLEIRKVALLYINNEGGVGQKNSFEKRFTQLGGQVLIEETYLQTTSDLRSQLTKIKSSDAEAVVVISYPKDTIIAMRQARELDLRKPLYFATEAVEDPNVLREAGHAAEEAIYITPAPAEGEVANRFAKLYEDKFGKKPELFAAEAYDIIYLVVNAIEATPDKQINAEAIKEYLYTIKDWAGASGKITFDNNGDVIKPMAIKIITNKNPIIVSIIKSEKER